jgi:hypothetical protein
VSAITFTPAKREAIALLIGLAGGTGSGKTYSALRIARGISGGDPFHVIDTENGRALHYADEFSFLHASLSAPFKPSRYAAAILEAEAQGAKVIVVDSTSHSWTGEGGVLEWHDRLEGGQASRKMLAWQEPKADHRVFENALLQTRAHVILCFRAAPKVEMRKGADGKIEVVPKEVVPGRGLDGWLPESDPRLPYEMTLSFLLMADAPGVPKVIKLPASLAGYVPLDAPLTETVGRELAAWSRGDEIAVAGEETNELELARLVAQLNDAGAITLAQVAVAVAEMRGGAPIAVSSSDPLADLTPSETAAMLTRLRRFAATLAGSPQEV